MVFRWLKQINRPLHVFYEGRVGGDGYPEWNYVGDIYTKNLSCIRPLFLLPLLIKVCSKNSQKSVTV